MSIEVEFQKALFAVLDGAKVSLGIKAVYDIKPQTADAGDGSLFPYVVIGDIYPTEWDTQTRIGFQVTNRIHVYSRSGSMAECKTIQGKIFDMLHRKPMTIAGYNHINQFREDTICNDGLNNQVHGICDYFGLVEKV